MKLKNKAVGTLLGVIALVLFYKSITRKMYKSDNIVLSPGDSSPSLSSDDARTYAKMLYDAMAGWGTDEDTILKVFNNVKNRADFVMLFNAFGRPDYGTFGAPAYGWLPADPLNLVGWLNHELSGENLRYVLQYYNV